MHFLHLSDFHYNFDADVAIQSIGRSYSYDCISFNSSRKDRNGM